MSSQMDVLASAPATEHAVGAGFCHEYELIGTALCGPTIPLTVTFISTVMMLIAAELVLGFIEGIVRDTQYESVKNKVFQEMTGIGMLSFLTILVNAGSNGKAAIPADYLHDLHHADLTIFIMSSLYLAQISTHMYLSSFQYKKWKIASGTPLGEIVEAHDGNSCSSKFWWWFGNNTARDQLEYKVLFAIFCRKFNIRKDDFNFAGYLNESFRGYIISLIEESFFVRLVFGALVAINVIRIDFFKSEHEDHECHDECKATKLLIFYACCGWGLIIACVVLVYTSRLYEFRLICRAGLNNISEYQTFLLAEEERDIGRNKQLSAMGARQNSLSLNKEDLKTTLQAIKEAKEDEFAANQQVGTISYIKSCLVFTYVWILQLFGMKVNRNRFSSFDLGNLNIDERSDEESISSDDDEEEEEDNAAEVIPEGNEQEGELDVEAQVQAEQIKSKKQKKMAKRILSHSQMNSSAPQGPMHNQLMKQMSFATILTLRGAIKHTMTDTGAPVASVRRSQTKRRTSVAGSHTGRIGSHNIVVSQGQQRSSSAGSGQDNMKDIVNLSTIFLFGLPNLYFSFVQIVMFLHGAYCSFYVTNFLILPSYIHDSTQQVLWQICIILPILLIIPLMRYIVKVSSVIKALSQIKQEVVAKVIEDDDAAEKSCQYLRLKLTARMEQFCGDDITELRETFAAIVDECDKQQKGYLNRSGFRYMLRKLKLHFTDKRFNEVMDVIDANFDEKLTSDELFQFVYPDKAKELEMKKREKSLEEANSNLIVRKKIAAASAKTDGSSVKARLTSLMTRGFRSKARIDCEPKDTYSPAKDEEEPKLDGHDSDSKVPLPSSFLDMGQETEYEELVSIDNQAALRKEAFPVASKQSNRLSQTNGNSDAAAKSNRVNKHESEEKSVRGNRSRTSSGDRLSPGQELQKQRSLSNEQAAALVEAAGKLFGSSGVASRPQSQRNSHSKSPGTVLFESPSQAARKGPIRFKDEADEDGKGFAGSMNGTKAVQFENDVLFVTMETPNVRNRKGLNDAVESGDDNPSRARTGTSGSDVANLVAEDLEDNKGESWNISEADAGAPLIKQRPTWSEPNTSGNFSRVEPFVSVNRKTIS